MAELKGQQFGPIAKTNVYGQTCLSCQNDKYKKMKNMYENIPRIGKLPYGAKRGVIERKALLKKGFREGVKKNNRFFLGLCPKHR